MYSSFLWTVRTTIFVSGVARFDLSDGTYAVHPRIERSMITKSGLRRLDCLNCLKAVLVFCFANYLEFRIGIEKSLKALPHYRVIFRY